MSRGRPLYVTLVVVACSTAAAVYALAPPASQPAVAKAAVITAGKTPTAKQFGHAFVGATNAYAVAHGEARRVGNAKCVQASRTQYMCSYTAKSPGSAAQCHLMQARWTPNAASTITVTLAGRADRCGTLREAIRSLA